MKSRKNLLFFIPLVGLFLFTFAIAQQRPVAAGQSNQLSDPKLCDKVYLPFIIGQSAAAKGDVGEGFAPPPQPQGAVECQSFADFNGDGYDDLAIGVPYEDVEAISNAGTLNIINGSQSGLTSSGNQILSPPTEGATYLADQNDFWGEELTTGDFNGDGYRDLVVGIDNAAIDGNSNAGAVQVFYGSATGFESPLPQHVFSQSGAINGVVEAGDRFGHAIAAGDFNGDGYDDLAVGSPGESVGSIEDAGAVNIIFGSKDGLTEANDAQWVEDDLGFFGVSQEDDGMGSALAAADFNRDGYADLAIGIPGQELGLSGDIINNAGIVFIMHGSATGPDNTNLQLWSQADDDVAGVEEEGDQFGTVLHTGDFNGDGYGDLAVGVPYENVGSVTDAGAVNVLFGSVDGLRDTDDQIFDADNAGFGSALSAADGHQFGGALTAGDYNGDGYADLVVGIPFQDLGLAPVIDSAGAAVIIPGGQNGLNASDYQFLAQNNNLIEGTAVAFDLFGFALTTGDFNGDGYADLGVGVPQDDDNINDTANAGNVLVFYGYEEGVLLESNEMWNQGTSGVNGALEEGDLLGGALP